MTDAPKEKKPRSNRRQMTRLVAARLSPSEFEAVREAAASKGVSMSSYTRSLLRKAIQQECPACHGHGVISVPLSAALTGSALTNFSGTSIAACPRGCPLPIMRNAS